MSQEEEAAAVDAREVASAIAEPHNYGVFVHNADCVLRGRGIGRRPSAVAKEINPNSEVETADDKDNTEGKESLICTDAERIGNDERQWGHVSLFFNRLKARVRAGMTSRKLALRAREFMKWAIEAPWPWLACVLFTNQEAGLSVQALAQAGEGATKTVKQPETTFVIFSKVQYFGNGFTFSPDQWVFHHDRVVFRGQDGHSHIGLPEQFSERDLIHEEARLMVGSLPGLEQLDHAGISPVKDNARVEFWITGRELAFP